MLGAIGLDKAQESAYRVLVALGAAEVPDLAHRLTLP
ncbi:MAG: helix-turn-helix transcriptional regulator, partial [Actinomycetota bacterium]|nr:helix-turn-helix transcriptional regulator [Actinomycetota bacterium]